MSLRKHTNDDIEALSKKTQGFSELTVIEIHECEQSLAKQLKNACNKHGKEVDLLTSAKLLHQLGKVYHQKGPDMISLIQSAALYNAAIARHQDFVEAKQDLQNLCRYILQESGAENINADLILQSKTVKK